MSTIILFARDQCLRSVVAGLTLHSFPASYIRIPGLSRELRAFFRRPMSSVIILWIGATIFAMLVRCVGSGPEWLPSVPFLCFEIEPRVLGKFEIARGGDSMGNWFSAARNGFACLQLHWAFVCFNLPCSTRLQGLAGVITEGGGGWGDTRVGWWRDGSCDFSRGWYKGHSSGHWFTVASMWLPRRRKRGRVLLQDLNKVSIGGQ